MMINKALVISGAFVGCSGIILTLVMCNAMNRSITNVLIGGFGDTGGSPKPKSGASDEQGVATEVTAEDVVDKLTSARNVIIVPGYGMAVAKAQHAIADITSLLRSRGIKVRFAIHPVAGRLRKLLFHSSVFIMFQKSSKELTFPFRSWSHECVA